MLFSLLLLKISRSENFQRIDRHAGRFMGFLIRDPSSISF
jgi:hypothetical protein